MTTTRGRYAGVLSIIQYNTRYYVASLCAMLGIAVLLWLRFLSRSGETVLIGAASLAAFWFFSSLLVSYYVYDYAGVTRWNWLPGMLSFAPQRWLNIHAGLDESTTILAQLFAGSDYTVLDIYDSREMTEPSIARARQLHPASEPVVVSKLDTLPLPDQKCDTVFLLFTAHEIRNPVRRAKFFLEVGRVLANSGQLLVVEHMRDWKNLVAFGPGFLHFYSRGEWLRVIRETGLAVEREDCITPFVRCFVMRKAEA